MKITATPERLRLLSIAEREGRHPSDLPPASSGIHWWDAVLADRWAWELNRELWLADVRFRLGLVTNEYGIPLTTQPAIRIAVEGEPEPHGEDERRADAIRQYWRYGLMVNQPWRFVTAGICQ